MSVSRYSPTTSDEFYEPKFTVNNKKNIFTNTSQDANQQQSTSSEQFQLSVDKRDCFGYGETLQLITEKCRASPKAKSSKTDTKHHHTTSLLNNQQQIIIIIIIII